MQLPSHLLCNAQALRRSARIATQFYEQRFAALGLGLTGFSILAQVSQWPGGSLPTMAAVAGVLAMDPTTLTRHLRPLVAAGLMQVRQGADRRQRVLAVTDAGAAAFATAIPAWHAAQRAFEARFGRDRARALRTTLDELVETLRQT